MTTPSKLIDQLRKNPEYKKILERMSDEERKLAEAAAEMLLGQFEQNVINPLKNGLKK